MLAVAGSDRREHEDIVPQMKRQTDLNIVLIWTTHLPVRRQKLATLNGLMIIDGSRRVVFYL